MNIDAKNLKRMRKCVGWDQHGLAYATRIPRWRFAFFETDRATFTMDERRKISSAILRQAQKNVAWLQEQLSGEEE